jgi:hypothetical protein
MRRSLFLGLGLLAACSSAPPTGSHTDGTIMCTGTAANEYRVDLAGSGFAEFKGKTLHAVTDIHLARSPGTCSTTSTAAIADGNFGVHMTNRTDDAVYPFIGAFIDLDGDGRCDRSRDPTWGIFGSGDSITLELSAERFSTADEMDVCSHFEAPATFARVYDEVLVPTGCTTGTCHGSGAGHLVLTTADISYERLVNVPPFDMTCGTPLRVLPGDPDQSRLWRKVAPGIEVCGAKMPKGRPALTDTQAELVKRWIAAGAPR